MRCAFFSYQPFLDINPSGQACASAATLDSITPLADVDLIYLAGKSNTQTVGKSLRKRFPEIKGIRVLQYDPVGSFKKRFFLLIRLLPLSLASLIDKNVVDLVADVHANPKYDVVHYDLMNWLYVHPVRHASIKPTVCSGTDAYSLAYTVKLKYQQKYYVYLRDWLSAIAFSRFEIQYLHIVDVNLFFSHNDVQYLENCGIQARYRTTNMPLEQKWFINPHPSDSKYYHRRILVSGLYIYPWYEMGVIQFLTTIWPCIVEKYQDAILTIHSTQKSLKVEAIAKKMKQVQLIGKVNDYRELFGKHDFFIHPLLAGTGQKNRLAIAMAQRLCCFASDAAVCGMELHPYEEYVPLTGLIENDIKNILNILENSKYASQIAAAGRRKMELDFSINAIGPKLIDIYEEAISHKIKTS